ncbi:MAG TPA: TMEM165/GDT1 family protein [Coriobacteriia bacterium]
MIYAFAVATILIALAELGDKTQLLALALACRYKAWQVIVGIFFATLAIHLLSTIVGQLVGDVIPRFWLSLVTGLLFIGFGVWTLRGDSETDEEAPPARFGPIVTVGIAFFLAELGDKTQIMTISIAADPAAVLRAFGAAGPAITDALRSVGLTAQGLDAAQTFWGVWLGSTVGMMIADGIAILVGAVLGKKLPERLITRISGWIFILFGAATLASAALSFG